MSEILTAGIARMKALAAENKDIHALISYGSLNASNWDKYSDLDFFLFTDMPEKYLHDTDFSWANQLGTVLSRVTERDDSGAGANINKLMFEDGLCIDIITVNAKKFRMLKKYLSLKKKNLASIFPYRIRQNIQKGMNELHTTLRRGYEIVYDKSNISAIIQDIFAECEHSEKHQLDVVKFSRNHHAFWQICHKMTIKIVRNDHYNAVVIQNGFLKKKLLEMIEWHTKIYSNEQSIISNGLKMSRWAAPEILEQLKGTYSYSGQAEMHQSLMNTIRLYQQLSHKIAAREQWPVNHHLEDEILKFIAQAQLN